jgi:2-iminoacetate synthase
LSVPYTGMILTARENADVRRELLGFGVSQIDAGSCIELGGYSAEKHKEIVNKEQFRLGDFRAMDEIVCELVKTGYVPSFCTSCYRSGRTGERFMEFAVPGFIEKFCTPNALITLMEYLTDYASERTKTFALALIESELAKIQDEKMRSSVADILQKIKIGDVRDKYF